MSARALVLTGFGINCEEETAAAFRLAGAEADIVHLNEIFDESRSINEFDVLALPGGFSFGDDLGAGKALANKLLHKRTASGVRFRDEIERFLGDGKFILGICNGFQILVKMGLLPDTAGRGEQEVTLTLNERGRFEDRWCRCVASMPWRTPFLWGISAIELPVRHGEGKLVIRDEVVRHAILSQGLNCLTYCDDAGRPTDEYPHNPNGSQLACAGLTDSSGQILGMMPHPEAYLSVYNHPNWGSGTFDQSSEAGEGLAVFRNIVEHVNR
ncbi:phosphoribosylformylglycinamidine synthase subunit PurQ [Candidatus Fermentibacteria bacterium]|nr:phosphoribosylformylglycinamidine synthase subunit PurQ [Candidatus Fermentibacteria bacterium]